MWMSDTVNGVVEKWECRKMTIKHRDNCNTTTKTRTQDQWREYILFQEHVKHQGGGMTGIEL